MNKKAFFIVGIVGALLLAGVSVFFYFNRVAEKEKLQQEYQSIIRISENATLIDYNVFSDQVDTGRVLLDPQKSENANVKWAAKRWNLPKQLYEVVGENADGTYFKLYFDVNSNELRGLDSWLLSYRVPVRTVPSYDEEIERIAAQAQEITYTTFADRIRTGLRAFEEERKNKNVKWVIRQTNSIDGSTQEIFGEFADGTYFKTFLHGGTRESTNFNGWMYDNGISVKSLPIVPKVHWSERLFLFAPMLLMIFVVVGLIVYLLRRQLGVAFKGFGKKEKREAGERPKERFGDVAGINEVIKEVDFIVKFFKKPVILRRLGGRPFKAVLLTGPPGCGKTLLAKAIAGEAGVNFFSISGSEFVEMFVGVGAMRIRDLFETAKKNAPAIIFIDEADSLGKRGAGLGDSGTQEHHQTLNQLLAELDGFDSLAGILVIFATNFPDLLDPALKRKGRINREIKIPLPSLEGRKEILKVHLRDQIARDVLAEDVDIDELANITYNFSGADLANLVNEAVFIAVRKEKEKVSRSDFVEAFDMISLGLAGKPVGDPEEKKKTAIHESGHVLISRLLPELKKLRMQVASILRRAESMGIVHLIQEGDIRSFTQKELEGRICFLLGGMAAEKIIYDGEHSSGAATDLKNATNIVQAMARECGMSPMGPAVLVTQTSWLQNKPSDLTIRDFELAEREILRQCEAKTEEILRTNREVLEGLAEALVSKEELREQEIQEVIKKFSAPQS